MLKRFAILIVSGLATATLFASVAACSEPLPGDDNRDGVIMEDESGWRCAEMGNRVCG